jgi:hypothetical protein
MFKITASASSNLIFGVAMRGIFAQPLVHKEAEAENRRLQEELAEKRRRLGQGET